MLAFFGLRVSQHCQFLTLRVFFCERINKNKDFYHTESQAFYNYLLEKKIRFIVQWIMVLLTNLTASKGCDIKILKAVHMKVLTKDEKTLPSMPTAAWYWLTWLPCRCPSHSLILSVLVHLTLKELRSFPLHCSYKEWIFNSCSRSNFVIQVEYILWAVNWILSRETIKKSLRFGINVNSFEYIINSLSKNRLLPRNGKVRNWQYCLQRRPVDANTSFDLRLRQECQFKHFVCIYSCCELVLLMIHWSPNEVTSKYNF